VITEPIDLTTVHHHLNSAQADGLACVVCGGDYTEFLGDTVPVGVSATGSQVFACETGCAEGKVCGPACVAPVSGVHTSCPGPLVGRKVASAR
jgi:hypothetical protein